ncbi:energy transducer TonB [Nitrosophilus labii]|uniref:energy transducer TonB n=1 Tax=Nitrosophilus labii TaxID=2706014 RepID=UPI0018D6F0B4|nr:energy transducer TonB [Nitrosophilus labii]
MILFIVFLTLLKEVEAQKFNRKQKSSINMNLSRVNLDKSMPQKTSESKKIVKKTTPKKQIEPKRVKKEVLQKREKIVKKIEQVEKKPEKKIVKNIQKMKKKVLKKSKIVKSKEYNITKKVKNIKPIKVAKQEIKKSKQKSIQPKKEEKIPKLEKLFKKTQQTKKETKKSEEKNLVSFLKQSKLPSLQEISKSMEDQKINELYQGEFDSFTKGQKEFIKNNLSAIGKITQKYLYIRGYPEFAVKTRQEGVNIVEFYLHPNGDISDLKIIKSSSYEILDKNSLETILSAYKDYPRPKEKTKIRIFVQYKIIY